ncbi:MAG: glycosyltransferase, partial [Balneolaceae bacterium]|nr:glycosyltransferase [Balneolaceae bacterium]
KFADVVTANSNIALDGMKSYVLEEKLELVPNPVFIPDQQSTPDRSKVVLNVGRLVPQKNQQLLIETFSRIDTQTLNGWSVEILGEGEEKENLQKKAEELNIKDQVVLHGKVADVEDYYLKSGIFVLSSVYEGTPNSLLEAMSFGLPPIVSNACPGALELITHGKNGLIFESEDADDLAEKLSVLMSDPDMRLRLGNKARETVKKFAPENVLPVWDRLLEKA